MVRGYELISSPKRKDGFLKLPSISKRVTQALHMKTHAAPRGRRQAPPVCLCDKASLVNGRLYTYISYDVVLTGVAKQFCSTCPPRSASHKPLNHHFATSLALGRSTHKTSTTSKLKYRTNNTYKYQDEAHKYKLLHSTWPAAQRSCL